MFSVCSHTFSQLVYATEMFSSQFNIACISQYSLATTYIYTPEENVINVCHSWSCQEHKAASRSVVPNLFLFKGHFFVVGGHGGPRGWIFLHSTSLNDSYSNESTGLHCQNGKLCSFCTYIFKILQEAEGHFLRPGGPLLARGPQVGNHWSRWSKSDQCG